MLKGLIIGIAWSVLIGVIINTLLNLAENSLAKNVLTVGLCVAGIISLPFLVAQFFKKQD